MTNRLPIHALDPASATHGQAPTYDAALGRVVWANSGSDGTGAGGAGEVLVVDGVTPPENLTTEDGDDWLYQG